MSMRLDSFFQFVQSLCLRLHEGRTNLAAGASRYIFLTFLTTGNGVFHATGKPQTCAPYTFGE